MEESEAHFSSEALSDITRIPEKNLFYEEIFALGLGPFVYPPALRFICP